MTYSPSLYVELTKQYAALSNRRSPEGERIAAELYRMSVPLAQGALSKHSLYLTEQDREEIFNTAFHMALDGFDPSMGKTWATYFFGAVRKVAARTLRDTRFAREISKHQPLTHSDDGEGHTDTESVPIDVFPDENGTTYETVRHEIERMDRFATIMESLPPVMAWTIRNRMRGVTLVAIGKAAGITRQALEKQLEKYMQYFPNADLCGVDTSLEPDSPCPWVNCNACGKRLKIAAHRGLCSSCMKW